MIIFLVIYVNFVIGVYHGREEIKEIYNKT